MVPGTKKVLKPIDFCAERYVLLGALEKKRQHVVEVIFSIYEVFQCRSTVLELLCVCYRIHIHTMYENPSKHN